LFSEERRDKILELLEKGGRVLANHNVVCASKENWELFLRFHYKIRIAEKLK
jgi:hypothetical protein